MHGALFWGWKPHVVLSRSGVRAEGGAALLRCLVLFFCCFNYYFPPPSHCRKQRRKRKAEEMETLNKNLPSKSEDVLETDVA